MLSSLAAEAAAPASEHAKREIDTTEKTKVTQTTSPPNASSTPSTPTSASPLRSLSAETKNGPPSPGRPKSSSGHTVSSLTLAMGIGHEGPERRSFLTDERADSSDEENLYAAAKASSITNTHESGDNDHESLSSSVREFMTGLTLPTGSCDLPSSLSTFMTGGAMTSDQEPPRTDFSNQTNLFIDTAQTGGVDELGHSGGRSLSEEAPTLSEIEVQVKAFAFYGKDLLNVALDYFDSIHTKLADLTAESLASLTAKKDAKEGTDTAVISTETEAVAKGAASTTRLRQFRLMAAEDDGDIMDDLPEFGLNTDVLGMGVNDFAVISRETGEAVLLLRIIEQSSPRGIHTHSPRSLAAYSLTGTPTAPMAIATASVSSGVLSDGSASSSGVFNFRGGPPEIQRSSTDANDPLSYSNLAQRRSTRAMSDSNVKGSHGETSFVEKSTKVRLCVWCREPKRQAWTIIKKIKVLQAVTDSHNPIGAGTGVSTEEAGTDGSRDNFPNSIFKGAANAAELSALRALAASTAYEIHGSGEEEVNMTAVTGAHGITERSFSKDNSDNDKLKASSLRGHESGKYSDSSSISAGEVPPPDGETWQHVTSYGSEGADAFDEDSVSQSVISEATGMSSLVQNHTYGGDGGDMYDIEGEEDDDNFNLSMEGSGKFNSSFSSPVHGYAGTSGNAAAAATALFRNRSTSNRSNPDGELFGMDMDM